MPLSPKELKIGSYVTSNKFSQVVRLELADFAEAYAYADGSDSLEWFDLHVGPILLTTGWLEKFGFKVKDDNPKQKPHYEGDILFDMCGFEFTNSVVSETADVRGFYSYGLNDGKTILRYVHQLQNLYFALTGEDLKLV